jgi:polysaccharide pyruvyl transferase WcaK-like protein
MKCILVSFFNSNNIGDIVIGDMLHKIISKQCTVEKLSYSGDINVKTIKAKERGIDRFKKSIYKILIKYNFKKVINLYYRNLKQDNFNVFEDKIVNVDTLIIGGGNMIFDLYEESNSVDRFDRFVKMAKALNKNVFAISIGIGPFKSKQQEINAVKSLSQCDYITFRDANSFTIFNKYNPDFKNVFITIDPVFLLPQRVKREQPPMKRIIGLNVINNKLISDSQIEYDLVISQYANLVKQLTNKMDVKLVLFCTEVEDYNAVLDVYSILKDNKDVSICITREYDELMKFYDSVSLIIGTRMHSMILAYTQRIPVIGLSYQKKVNEMFKIINKEEYLFEYNTIDTSISKIINCCDYVLSNKDSELQYINERLKKIVKKNNVNEQILRSLINKTKIKEDVYD